MSKHESAFDSFSFWLSRTSLCESIMFVSSFVDWGWVWIISFSGAGPSWSDLKEVIQPESYELTEWGQPLSRGCLAASGPAGAAQGPPSSAPPYGPAQALLSKNYFTSAPLHVACLLLMIHGHLFLLYFILMQILYIIYMM